MSSLGKISEFPSDRRGAVRRRVELAGSAMTIQGSRSIIVHDLCAGGAKVIGRRLPEPGEQVLVRTSELVALGRVGWAQGDERGVAFEEGEGPSAAACLGLQLKTIA